MVVVPSGVHGRVSLAPIYRNTNGCVSAVARAVALMQYAAPAERVGGLLHFQCVSPHIGDDNKRAKPVGRLMGTSERASP